MTATRQAITVLVVDDSEGFLAGASAWVASQPGLTLAGTARSGAQALLIVDELRPDLVLMDAAMPGIDGFEATRRLKARDAAPQIIILTFYDTLVARREAWASGADGFVAKADVSDRLMQVIRELFVERDGGEGPRASSPKSGGRPAEGARQSPARPGETTTERRGLAEGGPSRKFERGGVFAPPFQGRRIARAVLRAVWGKKEDRQMRKSLLKASVVASFVLALTATASFGGGKTTFVEFGEVGLVPFSLSADGTKAVGTGYFGAPGFYFTENEGVVDIGGGCGAGTFSISGDGSTIVGCTIDDNGKQVAAKWQGNQSWLSLGSVPGAVSCDASLSSSWGVDYYGQTAVGLVWLAQQCRAHAGYWDLLGGGPATDLGSFFPNSATRANGISGDGHTIVGWQDSEFGERQGAKWVDGVESSVLTDAGEYVGEVQWVNYDGTAMCGGNYPYGANDAWVWTTRKGWTAINTGPIYRNAIAVSASSDGSVVVGLSRDLRGNPQGWMWQRGKGLTFANDYAKKKHFAAGWNIWAISSVTPDGGTLTGYGTNANGDIEGFIIKNFN